MRMRSLPVIGLVTALALVMGACGDDDESAEEEVRDAATTVQSRVEGATQLRATLSGDTEVPGPGDPDGTGTASVNIDASETEVCYEVTIQRLDRPTGMHIHEGEAGESGDIVVPMETPRATDTTTTGCTNADAALIARILAMPDNFYVNVHTDAHPQGAIRGQLSQ